MNLPLLLLFTILFLTLSPPSSSSSSSSYRDNISWWCNSTPYPNPCHYYLSRHATQDPPKNRSDFYRLIVQVSFGLTLRAQSHLKRIGSQCHHNPQKAAWLDCLRLYSTTAVQLNRTLHASGPIDAQTWLSSALTNLDTCHKGFPAIGASPGIIWPVAKYNVTQLISNSLALNNATATAAGGDLPSWTSVANRKLLQLSVQADLSVAIDGSARYGSIKAALDVAEVMRKNLTRRIVIYVKAGVYSENLQLVNSLPDITIVGDGIGKTIITGGRSVANGYTTFSSPTFSVFGDGFIASGITFRNTYGPGSQAVALLSASDQSVFYRCGFEGYQDTLCVFSQRQFYRECDIYGTIDFIFGNAAVVFQNCSIYVRRPQPGEANVITAQGRIDPNQNTGIVIQFSGVRPTDELQAAAGTVQTYLGRPWQQYSRTLYLENYISGIINPAGWVAMPGNTAFGSLYYVEFKNTGPGSRLSRRVTWPGYHVIVQPSLVRDFTVGRFISGGVWLPSTGVPFYLSL